MAAPKIDVLGVYRLAVTEELFREQFDILYPYRMSDGARARAERQIREQLGTCVLIEIAVKDADAQYSASDFAQPHGTEDQAAYDEHYLTEDGEELLARWDRPKENCFRVAFYFHCFDPSLPLRTSYGDFMCPSPAEIPERLKRLVPFEPVD